MHVLEESKASLKLVYTDPECAETNTKMRFLEKKFENFQSGQLIIYVLGYNTSRKLLELKLNSYFEALIMKRLLGKLKFWNKTDSDFAIKLVCKLY